MINQIKLWKERAIEIGITESYNKKLVKTFFAVFKHSIKKNWRGACHGLSGILYVLLREQGINCGLEIGFVEATSISLPFCHSWVTIEGKVFDIGLYRANPVTTSDLDYIEVSPPIFKGVDLETFNPTLVSFGVSCEQELVDQNYNILSQSTLGEYMNGWPNHKDGLWGEANEIAKGLHLSTDISKLKLRYASKKYSPGNIK